MALSQRAKDILELLPGALIEIDKPPNHLTVVLPATCKLSKTTLDAIYARFGNDTACVIDFENGTMELSHHATAFKPLQKRPSGLQATTESERAAVAFADAMDVIDFDRLIPQWHLHSKSDCTELVMSQLLRVSHDALDQQLPSSCTSLVYNVQTGEIVLHFIKINKRKRF